MPVERSTAAEETAHGVHAPAGNVLAKRPDWQAWRRVWGRGRHGSRDVSCAQPPRWTAEEGQFRGPAPHRTGPAMPYGVARASAVMVTVTVGGVMSATNRRPPAWLAADRSEPAKLARLSVNQPVAAARQRGLGRRRSGPSSPEPTHQSCDRPRLGGQPALDLSLTRPVLLAMIQAEHEPRRGSRPRPAATSFRTTGGGSSRRTGQPPPRACAADRRARPDRRRAASVTPRRNLQGRAVGLFCALLRRFLERFWEVLPANFRRGGPLHGAT